MQKTFIMSVLLVTLALGLLSTQTAQAEEVVCGQWRLANCPFNGANTPVFVPCGSTRPWVLEFMGTNSPYSLFQNGQFVRLYNPSVSYNEGFVCDGQEAGYLWTVARAESISSCAACQPTQNPPVQNNPPSGYALCASEGQRCSFGGTKDIAYGANGQFNYKYGVAGGIDCNNNVFGDPISGAAKACYTKDSSSGNVGPSGYAPCSSEGQRCNFSGIKDVAYGANGQFNYKYGVTGGIDCNNGVFGDPISGAAKACYTKDQPPQPIAAPLVDKARFVADVTVPDGTVFGAQQKFTKTWRVQNTGTTTWNANYELVFVSGNSLGYGGTIKLGRTVRPQENTDISIQLTAPNNLESYTGAWKLSNAQRQLFGPQLTTVIKVSGATQLPDFKLPYAAGVKVYWTGGPHAYLLGGQFQALYLSGQGSGMDFANGGTFQVLAMAAGKVIDASCNNPGLGCQVAIKHDVGGSVLVYGHLREGSIKVSKNQTVKQGTILGEAGKTGSGAGANIHLHIELRDGSGSCRVQCMANPAFGNPIGWDDLVQLVDGWYIGGYLADTEGKQSRNYDGSAIRGTAIDLIYNFPYYDGGELTRVKVVRVHSGFKCPLISGKPAIDCELPANHTNPSGQTQFARDDSKGIAFPSNQAAKEPANGAGYLTSSNASVR